MSKRESYINSPIPIEKELLSIFRKKPPKVILDIGSCEGEDAIRYARLFPSAMIYAVEPLPSNQELVLKNFEKYKLENVELITAAFSDQEGEHEFHVSSGYPKAEPQGEDWDYGNKSSSLLVPDKHLEITPWVKFEESIKVKTITMDSFCHSKGISSIDFIHIDVQGAELKVLDGARNMFKNISHNYIIKNFIGKKLSQ
ncbi:MAG: FkbM family methyltransferase [Bacteroidetes bacterium]|nr:FkbM family methyltransferase [Bacteroidota bacterium]